MTIIDTERLLLRRLTLADLDDMAQLYADPEVMRFFSGTRTRQQTLDHLLLAQQCYEQYGYYLWATIHKADDRFIGRCGLLPQMIDGRQEVEVAYMLARPYWGQGLGTEAACAIKEYGFERYPFARLISLIDPDNLASIRVAEKNGMRYVQDHDHKGHLCRVYAVERSSNPFQ
jgi:ribosomal-protein-alanine N-acetyltransferase